MKQIILDPKSTKDSCKRTLYTTRDKIDGFIKYKDDSVADILMSNGKTIRISGKDNVQNFILWFLGNSLV